MFTIDRSISIYLYKYVHISYGAYISSAYSDAYADHLQLYLYTGLLSFPFFVFLFPVIGAGLHRARLTGYTTAPGAARPEAKLPRTFHEPCMNPPGCSWKVRSLRAARAEADGRADQEEDRDGGEGEGNRLPHR